jgi:opacity protein-like surface antigen
LYICVQSVFGYFNKGVIVKKVLLCLFLLIPALAFAQAKEFEGFNVELGVGYGQFSPSNINGLVGNAPYSAVPGKINTFLGVLGAGYNYAISNDFLLGVGATYFPSRSASASGTAQITGIGNSQTSGQVENVYSVYLKPAMVIDKESLVYAKIGYTGATAVNDGTTKTSLNGYLVGLGYQRNFNNHFYMFGEGKYASYGSKDIDSHAVTPSAINTGSLSANAWDMIVGVGYKF